MRVLVVEDEIRLSRQLAKVLTEAGYAVDRATDGQQADFLANTEQYDAVILDLGLPKIDGLTLLRQWRSAGIQAGMKKYRASTAEPTTTLRSLSVWKKFLHVFEL